MVFLRSPQKLNGHFRTIFLVGWVHKACCTTSAGWLVAHFPPDSKHCERSPHKPNHAPPASTAVFHLASLCQVPSAEHREHFLQSTFTSLKQCYSRMYKAPAASRSVKYETELTNTLELFIP